MKKIGALLIFIGALAAFAYPAYLEEFSGEPLGEFHFYKNGKVISPHYTVYLPAEDAPLLIMGTLKAVRGSFGEIKQNTFEFSLQKSGQPITQQIVVFNHPPDSAEQTDLFYPVIGTKISYQKSFTSGDYVVSLRQSKTLQPKASDLSIELRIRAQEANPLLLPIGVGFIVLGFLSLIFSGRSKRVSAKTNGRGRSKKPWGRQ